MAGDVVRQSGAGVETVEDAGLFNADSAAVSRAVSLQTPPLFAPRPGLSLAGPIENRCRQFRTLHLFQVALVPFLQLHRSLWESRQPLTCYLTDPPATKTLCLRRHTFTAPLQRLPQGVAWVSILANMGRHGFRAMQAFAHSLTEGVAKRVFCRVRRAHVKSYRCR